MFLCVAVQESQLSGQMSDQVSGQHHTLLGPQPGGAAAMEPGAEISQAGSYSPRGWVVLIDDIMQSQSLLKQRSEGKEYQEATETESMPCAMSAVAP